ncbi:MAG: hypothetical protein AcusKO_10210 [Acuticoccus sp.]
MRISQDFLANLRERVPLSAVIGRFVTWDRRKSQPGKGDLWACCPFHEEKTPSFHVEDRKGFYHCFGCHASGDHVRFLMDHQGLAFLDAVKVLADEAGVAMPEGAPGEERREAARRRQRSALDAAATLYEETLWSNAGEAARHYATGRGLSAETLRAFGFGLAPNVQGFLARQLAAQDYSEADIIDVGLAVRTERGPLRDRFRGRLMVPIHDGRGKLVGFGGRTLDGREPKYLNSPETRLFDKSSLLFNAHRARGAAHRQNRLFVVEGYLDAIALAEAGIETVVASLGTALTEEQIRLAWQLADEPVLCFDGDNAGRAAAARALERIVPLLSAGKSFQVLTLPAGQDPDDLVRAGGVAAFEALAQKAVPLVDALFAHESAGDMRTPERLAALEARLDALAASIPDTRVAALYRSAFRDRLFALRRAEAAASSRAAAGGRGGGGGGGGGGGRPGARPAAPPLRSPGAADSEMVELERIVLGLMIRFPALADRFGERVAGLRLASGAHQGLAGMIFAASAEVEGDDPAALLAALPDSARMCLAEVWGEPNDPTGPRLARRLVVLAADPPATFVARCAELFVMKLELRALTAELTAAPREWPADNKINDERLRSLYDAIETHRLAVTALESAVDDEAALLRRRKSGVETERPSDKLL